MQRNDIESYIRNNPSVGYRRVAELFNISDWRARMIKRDIAESIHRELFSDTTISDKQVASYLKARGLSIDSVREIITPKKFNRNPIGSSDLHEFSIGIIGDTHLCDKQCALDELYDYYGKCKNAGVKHIIHAGDLTAGIKVYPGQEFDLTYHGFSEQLKHVIESYPQIDGITTHVIAGNHDLSFKQHAGASFVEEVSNKRNDIEWVGDYAANISINGISIRLHHGDGGVGYAASYRLQRNVEAFESGEKPQIYVLGHYHRTLAMFIRNVHSYMPGCWQRPTDFSIRKGLPNQICGYIAHVKTLNDNRNSIRSISSEIITYY